MNTTSLRTTKIVFGFIFNVKPFIKLNIFNIRIKQVQNIIIFKLNLTHSHWLWKFDIYPSFVGTLGLWAMNDSSLDGVLWIMTYVEDKNIFQFYDII